MAGALDDGEAPAEVHWTGGAFLPAETPPDHPWVRDVATAIMDERGAPARTVGVPWGADMRLFAARGIACAMAGTTGHRTRARGRRVGGPGRARRPRTRAGARDPARGIPTILTFVKRLARSRSPQQPCRGCGGDETTAGGDDPAAALAVPWIDPDGDTPIVGALTVNPADSTLFMSTNTGLFRIEPGASKPEKVSGTLETPSGSGEVSEALVVRFSGPDELLGSGHPAAGGSLPSALGLIRSEDAGKTWTSVSELGKADFHAIELSGDTIAGSLFGQAQVLVSVDEGKTLEARARRRCR